MKDDSGANSISRVRRVFFWEMQGGQIRKSLLWRFGSRLVARLTAVATAGVARAKIGFQFFFFGDLDWHRRIWEGESRNQFIFDHVSARQSGQFSQGLTVLLAQTNRTLLSKQTAKNTARTESQILDENQKYKRISAFAI